MRLLAYIRVSSAGQASHGHSLDDQPEPLQADSNTYGYTHGSCPGGYVVLEGVRGPSSSMEQP